MLLQPQSLHLQRCKCIYIYIYIYTYIDIANIFRDICIVIVCDSAQLLVSHDFIVVTPKKMQNRFNLSIKFWIWFYSNFHLFGGLLYIHKSLSEDTKNIPSKVLECPPPRDKHGGF